MRIATWNLERGGRSRAARPAQEETLRALSADVVVLTEPPAAYRSGPGIVTSPALRSGVEGRESWVAIVGAAVEPIPLEVPYERLAVAARIAVGGRSHAPEIVRDGEEFSGVFSRVLESQRADLSKLRANGEPVVWAGDFNQSVAGPNQGGSKVGRAALNKCLADLDLVAWNSHADHGRGSLRAVDLICGPKAQAILAQGRIDPTRNGVRMSDHAGYWVDL
jgi:endonuclease/exonuclease/phosphatase family metal-dependent hydrolase